MKRISTDEADASRREFLKKCGGFAVITPPAVTFLLSTSMSSKAIAVTSGVSGIIHHGGGEGLLAVPILGAGAAAAAHQPQPVAVAAPPPAPTLAPPPPVAVQPPPPPPPAVGERG